MASLAKTYLVVDGQDQEVGVDKQVLPGSDMKIRMPLSLEEIAFGTEKTLKVKKQIICNTCKGTGAASNSDYETCGTCNGMGKFGK